MKHVLITGGNKGIGLATANLFKNENYKVTVLARDFKDNPCDANCNCISFDLKEIDKIKEILNQLAPVDILINNAGIMHNYEYDNYPEDKKRDIIKVNLEAPIELMNCVSKSMIINKTGRIVNNASIAGQIGHPDVWYGITKAGLINATKSYANQLGKYGIIINAIAASPVETNMLHTIPDERKKGFLKKVYSNRFAKPDEIAETIFWLATQSPLYINGTCIDINGGTYLR